MPDGQNKLLLEIGSDKWPFPIPLVKQVIINQAGKLFQRNLGEKTGAIASALVQYNPSGEWTVVDQPGVLDHGMTARRESRLEIGAPR